jgi:hypothetical protein
MANRLDYYFRQRVTEAELDLGFAELEEADQNLAADLGFTGVLANAVVSQHAPVADLTVDISGPASILDSLGQRIFFSSLQNVNVAADDNGVATEVLAAGKEKIVSVFVMFDRSLSDPRVDGNSLTVFFRRDESFKFIVVQGAEAPAGGAIPPPLRSDAMLLADVTRAFSQAQVLGGSISIARRQDAFVLTGSPRSLRRGRTLEAVSDLLGYFNAHVGGVGDRHPADSIDYAGSGSWADGTTNPAATVEQQLDKLVADLAAASGAPKIGAGATGGTPNAFAQGTVKLQLDALLGYLNAHITQTAGAHAASAISYAGGAAWADGTANPAATVEQQLDKVITDLGGTGGGDKLGVAVTGLWADGTGIASTRVRTALDEVLFDLAAATPGGDGTQKIGAASIADTPSALPGGTARTQLTALLAALNGHVKQASGAHAASAISYAGGPSWKDGTTNPAGTVEDQLDGLVSALIADLGASRIGVTARTAWLGGRTNPAGVSVFAALDKIITDLGVQVAADDGARRIGAQASGNLPVGSVRTQLDSLDATSVRTNIANVFTAAQTVNGAAGDTNAALITTAQPVTRKLLWEIIGISYSFRFYSSTRTLEITLNARWNGTQWVKDSTSFVSLRFGIHNAEIRVCSDDALVSPFSDSAWPTQVALGIQSHGSQSFDAGGNWISPGQTTIFLGWQGQSPPSGGGTLGTAASFRKYFPATPSSITFTVYDSVNIASGPTAYLATPSGSGATVTLTTPNTATRFYAGLIAS